MAAKDLITLSRAYQDLQGVSGVDSLISTLITACSDAIAKYCRRDFVQQSYDEVYSGNGDRRLLLREYPLLSVQSVRYRPTTVLKVTNTDATNVQARVTVLSTGLQLVRVKNGVKTTVTSGIDFTTNPTLSQLATAVSAVGNGWSATVPGDATNYGSWPSADLYWPPAFPTFGGGTAGQGALQCVGGSYAELKMHTYELAGFQWDSRGWLLRAIPYTDPELLHPEDLVWPVGINNLRVQYTAGYTTVPEAVQEACAQWVAQLYYNTQRDPALRSQSQQGSISQRWSDPVPGLGHEPPGSLAALLQPYRRHSIGTNQG